MKGLFTVLLYLSLPLIARGQAGDTVFIQSREIFGLAESYTAPIFGRNMDGYSYLPAFAKEKLAWIRTEMIAGRVDLRVSTVEKFHLHDPVSHRLMMTTWEPDGKGVITVMGVRLWHLVKVEGSKADSTMHKNSFVIGLVHEAVHLEQERVRGHPDSILVEEMRVWRKVSLGVVRPLREMGSPVHWDFLHIDDVLKRCGDRIDCPEFRSAIAGRTAIALNKDRPM